MHNRPTLHSFILYKLSKISINAAKAHFKESFEKHKDNLQKYGKI